MAERRCGVGVTRAIASVQSGFRALARGIRCVFYEKTIGDFNWSDCVFLSRTRHIRA